MKSKIISLLGVSVFSHCTKYHNQENITDRISVIRRLQILYGDNTHTPDRNISDVTRKAFRILEQKYPLRETKHREKIFHVLVHIFEYCIGICIAKSIKLLQKIFPHRCFLQNYDSQLKVIAYHYMIFPSLSGCKNTYM